MNIAKTLTTLSLALALQGGALVAATVVLAPSDAAAFTVKKPKPDPRKRFKNPKKCNPLLNNFCIL